MRMRFSPTTNLIVYNSDGEVQRTSGAARRSPIRAERTRRGRPLVVLPSFSPPPPCRSVVLVDYFLRRTGTQTYIMLILLLNIRLTAPLQTIAGESNFFFYFHSFFACIKFKISCDYKLIKKKKCQFLYLTRARVVIVYCRACVASSPSHGFHTIIFTFQKFFN